MNSDGSVKNIYVVNIFDLTDGGEIIDYGDYTKLRNMTTNDKINFENQTVKINIKAKKLYYEDTLNKNVIPWNFSFRYYLDSKEYKAEELIGKSGKLEIKISIRQNKEVNSVFFDNYSLQASISLELYDCAIKLNEGSIELLNGAIELNDALSNSTSVLSN